MRESYITSPEDATIMSAARSQNEKYYTVNQNLFSWLRDREQEDFPLGTNYVRPV